MRAWFTARRLAACLIAGSSVLFQGCADGHFNLLGYTTEPSYDCAIRTVYVPIPQNVTYRRGLEFDLKRAIDREINTKTPYIAVSSPDQADTELVIKIVNRTKNVINYNQAGLVREAETILGAEVTWLDKRPGHLGEMLCKPAVAGPQPQKDPPLPEDPLAPLPPPPPVAVTAQGTFIPELGGSLGAAERQMVDRMALQIVSMMEKPW